MQLVGVQEIKALFAEYPARVVELAARTGLRQSAKVLRNHLRDAAPRRTGKLEQAINYKRARGRNKFSPRYKVGLQKIRGDVGKKGGPAKVRYYYKTLEFQSERGPAMHPFFQATYDAHRRDVAQLIIDETRKAVYSEAGKIHRKTLGLKRRR